MNYEQWLKLFGRAANDPDVAATVALAGISKNLAIATDELSVAADVPSPSCGQTQDWLGGPCSRR